MIIVIVITGIIGGIVAVFLRAPIRQYMDVARRADMSDIADTTLRRIGRDLRLALPNSVRVTNSGGTVYLEYLETVAGGRYNSATTPADCMYAGGCTKLTTTGNLVVDGAGTLVDGDVIPAGAEVVVYNQYNNSGGDCSGTNPSAYCAAGSGGAPVIGSVTDSADQDQINFAAFTFKPSGGSPNYRFQIVTGPVTYACTPNGSLVRYWGYAITPAQPTPPAGGSSAVLANNIGGVCDFTYNNVSQRFGLVTMNMQITEADTTSGTTESVTLYDAVHVSNVP